MNEDGSMARLPDLVAFAQRHALKIGTITDLIAYRRRHDNLVRESDQRTIVSEYGGTWQLRVFADQTAGTEHLVLTKGDIAAPEPVLVRMHAVNPLEDLLGAHSARSHQLRDAMLAIAAEGRGVVVVLRDMSSKLDLGDHVSPHRLRQYGIGAQILNALGLHELILLTNSPSPRVVGLDGYGLSIAGTRPIPTGSA
jgi:3,4-dihydroxy 2-butanone 4-phosphate synthase/GTP cyclohydrolase II